MHEEGLAGPRRCDRSSNHCTSFITRSPVKQKGQVDFLPGQVSCGSGEIGDLGSLGCSDTDQRVSSVLREGYCYSPEAGEGWGQGQATITRPPVSSPFSSKCPPPWKVEEDPPQGDSGRWASCFPMTHGAHACCTHTRPALYRRKDSLGLGSQWAGVRSVSGNPVVFPPWPLSGSQWGQP